MLRVRQSRKKEIYIVYKTHRMAKIYVILSWYAFKIVVRECVTVFLYLCVCVYGFMILFNLFSPIDSAYKSVICVYNSIYAVSSLHAPIMMMMTMIISMYTVPNARVLNKILFQWNKHWSNDINTHSRWESIQPATIQCGESFKWIHT